MRLISAQELKQKLDRGDPVKLVNALGDWEYRAAHIPGSLHFSTPEETLEALGRDDEIVVHCSNPSCMASVALYQLLERNGYRNPSTLRWRPVGLAGSVSAGRDHGGCSGRRTQHLRRPGRHQRAGHDNHPVVRSVERDQDWSCRRAPGSRPRPPCSCGPGSSAESSWPPQRPAITGGTCPCTRTCAARPPAGRVPLAPRRWPYPGPGDPAGRVTPEEAWPDWAGGPGSCSAW
jgi:rhodanese-related sulfurtransferase